MSDEVRVGFIGCGGNARGHMKRVAQLPSATIAAVCDLAEEAATKAAEDHGARPFTNHCQMLDAVELDAVYISIPPDAHGEPELDAIERGLALFVEKPVALDLQVAQRIAAAIRQRDILTCVGYQLRYTAAAAAARDLLAEKTIGMVVGRYWCGSGRGDWWLQKFARSGGQIVEQATHTIDMMRFLAGEVVEVFSYQANRTLSTIDCPDHNVVAMKFASGALGSLTACWAFEGWEGNILDVLFERYRLHWEPDGLTIAPEYPEFSTEGYEGRSIDAVFIEAVRTGDRSAILTPYEDAIKSLAVSLAANDSARTGAPRRVAGL